MSEVFIISAVRTPIGFGKEKGVFHPISPVDLTSMVFEEAVRRSRIEPDQVNDVVWGCVTPIGDQGANLARFAVLKSEIPMNVPAVTIS